MNFLFNISLYILILLLVLQNHLVFGFLLVIVFTYRVGALWLLPLGFLIDGYFGAFANIPYMSITAIGWYVLSEFVRPKLLVHYRGYEKAS